MTQLQDTLHFFRSADDGLFLQEGRNDGVADGSSSSVGLAIKNRGEGR